MSPDSLNTLQHTSNINTLRTVGQFSFDLCLIIHCLLAIGYRFAKINCVGCSFKYYEITIIIVFVFSLFFTKCLTFKEHQHKANKMKKQTKCSGNNGLKSCEHLMTEANGNFGQCENVCCCKCVDPAQ